MIFSMAISIPFPKSIQESNPKPLEVVDLNSIPKGKQKNKVSSKDYVTSTTQRIIQKNRKIYNLPTNHYKKTIH